MIAFLSISILVTLVAVAFVAVPLMRRKAESAPVAGLLTALTLPVVVVLGYVGVSDYPWSAPRDVTGWVALGDGHLAHERFAEARDAFRQAMNLDKQANDDIQMAFAEASVLADRAALQGEAGEVVEAVLARDPLNAKALWYGGMIALARGDAAAARARWSRLLEFSPPPAVRQVIEQQIATLDSGPAAKGNQEQASAAGTRLPVRIRIAPELRARVDAGAILYLIARAPGGSGPPIAVVRRDAALPMDTEISDSDAMLPGRSLADLEAVQLTARIANGGGAIASAGDVYGDALWRPASPGSLPVEIVIDKVVN